MVIFTDNY